jgi:hypothetical protein
MSKSEFWCHSVSICCAVLTLVQETAFLRVRVCACRFGSVLWSGADSCNTASYTHDMLITDLSPLQTAIILC